MKEIALEMGISRPAVSRLLGRALFKGELAKVVNFTVKPTPGRPVRAISLSSRYNY